MPCSLAKTAPPDKNLRMSRSRIFVLPVNSLAQPLAKSGLPSSFAVLVLERDKSRHDIRRFEIVMDCGGRAAAATPLSPAPFCHSSLVLRHSLGIRCLVIRHLAIASPASDFFILNSAFFIRGGPTQVVVCAGAGFRPVSVAASWEALLPPPLLSVSPGAEKIMVVLSSSSSDCFFHSSFASSG